MYPFTDGSYAPRNAWYVAAFPHEITREILGRWILNEPVVFYRKEDGTAVAVAGRCPHRHYPLAEGSLVGDSIQCGYHGLVFGANGACQHVPSQPSVPNSFRLKTYPLVQRGMWVWIWPGDPALADESLLPTVEEIGIEESGWYARPFYVFDVKARYQLLNDNLLDLSHLGFLHDSSIGTTHNATTPEVRDQNARRLRSTRNIKNSEQPPVQRSMHANYDGLVDRVSRMDFFWPGFHSGIDDTMIPSDHPTRAEEVLKRRKVWHAVTPTTLHESMYFFGMGTPKEIELDFLYKGILAPLKEDVFAAEEIEKMITKLGFAPPELLLRSDATAARGRKVLQTMIDAERHVKTNARTASEDIVA